MSVNNFPLLAIEILPNGVRKYYEWGYSEITDVPLVDCFAKNEVDAMVKKLGDLPTDSLSDAETALLSALKLKRKTATTVPKTA